MKDITKEIDSRLVLLEGPFTANAVWVSGVRGARKWAESFSTRYKFAYFPVSPDASDVIVTPVPGSGDTQHKLRDRLRADGYKAQFVYYNYSPGEELMIGGKKARLLRGAGKELAASRSSEMNKKIEEAIDGLL